MTKPRKKMRGTKVNNFFLFIFARKSNKKVSGSLFLCMKTVIFAILLIYGPASFSESSWEQELGQVNIPELNNIDQGKLRDLLRKRDKDKANYKGDNSESRSVSLDNLSPSDEPWYIVYWPYELVAGGAVLFLTYTARAAIQHREAQLATRGPSASASPARQ